MSKRQVWIAGAEGWQRQKKKLPAEQPFEIQVRAGSELRSLGPMTRTPGNDYELTAGLLLAAGYVAGRRAISHMTYCLGNKVQQEYNLLTVVLRRDRLPPLPAVEAAEDGSNCGVSSRMLLDRADEQTLPALPDGPSLPASLLAELAEQGSRTLPTASLYDEKGVLVAQRSDVQPAQALDKLLGWALLNDRLPLPPGALFFPGRATFATVQRSVRAGVSLLCCLEGPPSSLAVSLAHRRGMTLAVVDGEEVQVYTGRQRLTT